LWYQHRPSPEEPCEQSYDRITTTIEREWLAEIIAGTKKIEYRQIKPYWTKRFRKGLHAI
jgi:hypothetical protein